jgi:hypothetical protein
MMRLWCEKEVEENRLVRPPSYTLNRCGRSENAQTCPLRTFLTPAKSMHAILYYAVYVQENFSDERIDSERFLYIIVQHYTSAQCSSLVLIV